MCPSTWAYARNPIYETTRRQNTRTAYVGPTRGREDIRVYTNDKERMVRDLSRDVSPRSAIEQPTMA